MRAAIERDGESGGAELGVVGGQPVVADAAQRDRVDAGRVAVAVAVVVCEATVPGRPDVDVSFASPALVWNKKKLPTKKRGFQELLHRRIKWQRRLCWYSNHTQNWFRAMCYLLGPVPRSPISLIVD